MQETGSSILTVSELSQLIKQSLESQFSWVRLQGEVSNLKVQSSGHIYFSLKDENATISAVIFRSNAASLIRPLHDGDKIIVEGKIALYAPQGRYQIVIQSCHFAGVGELLLKLEELKKKLAALGMFDEDKKKPLPLIPKTIGVVTSPTGAVIRDILHVLRRRFRGFHLILNPVKVQGDGAKEEIAAAIRAFNAFKMADILIVGRGGGSIEDLWAFNEEIVVRAIHESRIPIISAVGHETDVTLADFAADVRAPTPSAAAEIAIAHQAELLKRIDTYKKHLDQNLLSRIRQAKKQLATFLKHPIFQSGSFLFAFSFQKLDDLRENIERNMQKILQQKRQKINLIALNVHASNPKAKLNLIRNRLERIHENLDFSISTLLQAKKRSLSHEKRRALLDMWITSHIQKQKRKLSSIQETLAAINPKKLLNKGYAIVFSEKKNSAISSVLSLNIGEQMKILFKDGSVHSTVESIEN